MRMNNVISGSFPSGGKSVFDANLKALNPIRWYPLDDFTSGGTMRDLGSQNKPGTYAGSSSKITPGLVPGRASCIGMSTNSDPGCSFPSTGLPTGASPWTLGGLVYIWFRSPSLGKLCGFNGVDLDWGSSAFEIVTPAGSLAPITGTTFATMLFVGTYDGTTTKVYLYTCSPSGGDNVLGSGSAAQSLNLTASNGLISSGNGDFLSQDIFILSTALTQTQIANLANSAMSIQ
jgi:hypothetical protein